MATHTHLGPHSPPEFVLPSLAQLGCDLTHLTNRQRWFALALPFLCVAAYVLFALFDWWLPAIAATAMYTFVSYGSTSHDLVHGNLGLPRRRARILLSLIELMGLRSGHAYRAAHLHHHRRFPHADDIEGAAAHGSLLAALFAGPLHQPRVWWWALNNSPHNRMWIAGEGLACLVLVAGSIVAWSRTPIPIVYAASVILGSWTFPLITAYLPHDPSGVDELSRTKRIRGKVASFVFRDHYYHLEHHLYPAVPYPHWPELAARLDPYLDRAQVKPIYFGF